jgi:hypothetical protein
MPNDEDDIFHDDSSMNDKDNILNFTTDDIKIEHMNNTSHINQMNPLDNNMIHSSYNINSSLTTHSLNAAPLDQNYNNNSNLNNNINLNNNLLNQNAFQINSMPNQNSL